MALSETAKLLASLELKDKFSPTIAKANKSLGQFDAKLDNSASRSYKAGQQIGTGIKNVGKLAVVGFGIVAAQVALGVNSLIKVEDATAQTEAVIKSTGGAAHITAGQVREMAESFEALNATVGDEVIQSAENMLLTFTNVRKNFKRAQLAALDLNTGLGKGPEGLVNTTKAVGKALNDPIKGLGALGKAGINFTKTQTKQIKDLIKQNDLFGAQGVILKELEKRFGGRFAAAGDTARASIAKFNDAIEDTQRTIATAALPAVRNIADALTELVKDPEIQKGAAQLGVEIGKALSKDNIKNAATILGGAFKTIKSILPGVASAVGLVADAVGKAVAAFMALPEPIKQLLVGGFVVNKLTGGLVTNIAGGLFDAFAKGIKAPLVNVQGGVVNVGGGVPGAGAGGAGAAAGAAKTGIGTLGKLFLVGEAIGLIAAVEGVRESISNDSTKHSEDLKNQTRSFIDSQPDKASLTRALDGVNTGIKDLQSNPLLVLVQGEALDNLKIMKEKLTASLAENRDRLGDSPTNPSKPKPGTVGRGEGSAGRREFNRSQATLSKKLTDVREKVEAAKLAQIKALGDVRSGIRDRIEAAKIAGVAASDRVKAAADTVRDRVEAAKIAQVSATNAGSASIVGALHSLPTPIVNVTTNVDVSATTVQKKSVVIKRYGMIGGSKNTVPGKKP